jgi:crotonobetainyl-CoA:carnitine CoA-transferase CaiB-like acyl-CoA transferase
MRVLDLTRLAPGPFASLLLADLGAEVIKVEEPSFGDPARYPLSAALQGQPIPVGEESVLFRLLNRGKKSITCNLKSIQGRVIMMQLISGVDVLMEGFRPGVMKRLGLDYEATLEVNPRLVYASLSGYGQTGPYREKACHDLACVALSGWLDLTGAADGAPALSAIPIADMTSALWLALAVNAALLSRERTGKGCYLDISMLDSLSSLLAVPLAEMASGSSAVRRGNTLLSGTLACYNRYETQDGLYMSLAAIEPRFWESFCLAVGREEWLTRQLEPDQSTLIADVSALFLSQPRSHWVELMSSRDCCCEPVLSLEEATAHPQIQARGLWQAGVLHTPLGICDQVDQTAPRLGEYTAQVLAELGYTLEDVERLRSEGAI